MDGARLTLEEGEEEGGDSLLSAVVRETSRELLAIKRIDKRETIYSSFRFFVHSSILCGEHYSGRSLSRKRKPQNLRTDVNYLTTWDEKLLRNTRLLTQPTKICIAKAGTTLTANKVGTIHGKTIVNGEEI